MPRVIYFIAGLKKNEDMKKKTGLRETLHCVTTNLTGKKN
jgi:hypothetical protein